MSDYFSDRESGPRARIEQEISPQLWAGLVAIVQAAMNGGGFGMRFPERCPDGQAICGCDEAAFGAAVGVEMPGLKWPLETSRREDDEFTFESRPYAPPTFLVLDFLEFVWASIARPLQGWHHDFFRHYHLEFDVDAGQAQFCADINRIFGRNGLAYQMSSHGKISRVLPATVDDCLRRAYFRTGDSLLDTLLEESRSKFTDPHPVIRREALERLWDCWERLKTLADADKKKSITAILDVAAPESDFRKLLEVEARVLSEIGNSRLIRHYEVSQIPVIDVDHVDYLYMRMFAMILLLIRKNAPRS